MANKSNDMAHTKWVCKYHIVFTPKYRRKAIYNQYKESIRDILKQLCAYTRCGDIRRKINYKPCPYVGKYTTEI